MFCCMYIKPLIKWLESATFPIHALFSEEAMFYLRYFKDNLPLQISKSNDLEHFNSVQNVSKKIALMNAILAYVRIIDAEYMLISRSAHRLYWSVFSSILLILGSNFSLCACLLRRMCLKIIAFAFEQNCETSNGILTIDHCRFIRWQKFVFYVFCFKTFFSLTFAIHLFNAEKWKLIIY